LASSVAYHGLLAAPPGVEPARLVPLAERALAGAHLINPGFPTDSRRDCLETLALAHYRAGQFERALQRLNEVVKGEEGRRARYSPTGLFLLALAHRRLGHAEEARKWLKEALASPANTEEPGPAEALRAEAKALFGKDDDARGGKH
jgi:tetratricopeptide (TPR) repeat protein